MEQQILSEILKKTFRYHDLTRRIRILKAILVAKFFGEDSKIDVLPKDQDWIDSLSPEIIAKFNKDNIYQVFEILEKLAQDSKYLVIYLSFELNDIESEKVGNHLRLSYGPNFLYETSFDPDIIGGAALSWGGNFKDYSIRAKINDQKQEVLQSLRKVFS